MRMVPSRLFTPEKPLIIKKKRARTVFISPPIKGMMEDARVAEADGKFASLISNMYINDDRLTVRAGYRKIATCAGAPAIEHLIPYYGSPDRLLAAGDLKLFDGIDGTVLKSGFTSNNWHWTMFSDLGDIDYAVMVNGFDGVWSWDGQESPDAVPITITNIGKATAPATDAVVTVGSTTGLLAGDIVVIAGADAAHAAANGPQQIVNLTLTTFDLYGVDSSGWSADQTAGTMTVVKQGSFKKEAVKAPAGAIWIDPETFSIVTPHMNRLFFADDANLAVYYLPLQQKSGEVSVLPVNAIFKRGGTIRALATWTTDGGTGVDDQLVIFTSNGEIAIYSGVDPESDFSLVGVFRLEPVQNKWSTVNYGGELYALLPTGLTPMSSVLKAGLQGTEAADKSIVTLFQQASIRYKHLPGWEVFINPSSGRVFCNVPRGGAVYQQMVRDMAKPRWVTFDMIPARCWSWLDPNVYFADDVGNVYEMHPSHQSDDGKPIQADVMMAWSRYKTVGVKQFKMILPYISTNGYPRPALDMKVDFDMSPAKNFPEITEVSGEASMWDEAMWDMAPWTAGVQNWANWTGLSRMGRVGAIRMTVAVKDCTFSCTGWDVIYEEGAVFG